MRKVKKNKRYRKKYSRFECASVHYLRPAQYAALATATVTEYGCANLIFEPAAHAH